MNNQEYNSYRDKVPLLGSGWWIGYDLDGTLARYDKFVSALHIGEPVPNMVNRCKIDIDLGYDVRIFTARVDGGAVAKQMGLPAYKEFEDVLAIKLAIKDWCIKHLGSALPVTNVKDFGMLKLYDDRAISVIMNSGQILHEDEWGLGYKEGYITGKRNGRSQLSNRVKDILDADVV